MTANEIRAQFLNFFESKKHKIVPSAPLINKDDPTLMFVNSGMVPFKDYFLGHKKSPNPRVADTQKCLRVSGKHNDLEDVGKDTYHHTFFEMLGNWSFGDYFKEDAIDWAWELLTVVFKIPKENLYVTIFEGSASDQLEMDSEAKEYWKKHIAEDRILLGNKKDNFWEMGDQGPCGPCSEIHVDIRSEEEKKHVSGKSLVNQDHPQVIEIWNLVFMQFLRKADGSLEKLASKNIDTGMGFERLCMVLQGKTSNYDTDVFTPLIHKLENITSVNYHQKEETDIAIRVVVDHLRTVAFSIADGQLPSNSGAGYVIKRILRRAVRYGYSFLNCKEPFMYQLVDTLVHEMGGVFKELVSQKAFITNTIMEEEKSFLRTLENGLIQIDSLMESNKEDRKISGEKVFELYDTFGFPADLTRLILEENDYTFDHTEFEKELEKQRQRSKSATATETDDWVVLQEDIESEFIGYDQLEATVNITQYRKVSTAKENYYQLVFDRTPFYAESGGQIGDTGNITNENESVEVINTIKENNLIVHQVKKLPKEVSAAFTAKVDTKRRADIMKNHSATHLLQQALRHTLGNHVEQKGSYVGPEYLRFDFAHPGKMSKEEIVQVEDLVNQEITNQWPLEEARSTPIQNALDHGATALFGEKYGEFVRTVKFGDSYELCGGTHVANTADIKWFRVLNESSIASGVRRIEAITGDRVINYYQEEEKNLEEIKELLRQPKDPVKATEQLIEENQRLKKEIEKYQKESSANSKQEWINKGQTIQGITFIGEITPLEPALVKNILFELKGQIDPLVAVIGSDMGDKAGLSILVSDALVKEKGYDAGKWIKENAKNIQGGGGGQPFFATAGGKNSAGLPEVIKNIKEK